MKKTQILIFAYYSYKDPVFQSAVLPYFVDFPNKEEYEFVLMTFEQKRYRTADGETEAVRRYLKEQNIIWYPNTWHSGSFKIIKKGYDLTAGLFKTLRLIRKHNISLIYSEGFPGAIIAHFAAKFSRRKHIVHSFEPHADYMIEGGVWKPESWESLVQKAFEHRVARSAAAILTATQHMIDRLKPITNARLLRVPSCVDLAHFRFDSAQRESIRKSCGIAEDGLVIVYLGKIGGMYWREEIFAFFRECLKVSDRFSFFFFTPDDQAEIKTLYTSYGIPEEKIKVGYLRRDEVPAYLSAADFGLVPVHQYPSKRYCSPIKDGEYWACGLPIIIPAGVSDDYLFASEKKIGMVVEQAKEDSYRKTVEEILRFSSGSRSDWQERCRNFVVQDRNVQAYRSLYSQLFNELSQMTCLP